MSIRVAVIGAGVMGTDHARILAAKVRGATLQVVCDTQTDRARRVADAFGATDISTHAVTTITRQDVDAVLIASPDDTHAPLTIAAIEAGKPVLCEKPLAPSSASCLAVIQTEVNAGRRFVQTGFMRRFDPSYVEMKAALAEGALGEAVMMHNFHRNVEAPEWFTGEMAISNSAPHEFDIARYVLGTEYHSISVFQGTCGTTAARSAAPVFMVLETTGGPLVNVEVNNNAAYGYDIRGELVGEHGSVLLNTPVHAVYNTSLKSVERYASDWRPRFADAYRLQNKAWLDSIETGKPASAAANAWDGYCATAVAEAGVKSLAARSRIGVDMVDMPAIYRLSAQTRAARQAMGEKA
ncbi:MAG: Gfo/Idh/MocA family oxidoreductase [Pseudomonadota bacterium]